MQQERRRPAWRNAPLQFWLDAGINLLKERRISEAKYRGSIVKRRVLHFVAMSYWAAIVDYAKVSGLVVKKDDEYIEQAIGRLLGLSPSSYSRWLRNQTSPGADKVFGTLVLVLRKELDEVGLPRNSQVAWLAASSTLSRIRKEDLGLDRLQIDREEFALVRTLVQHPLSDVIRGVPRPYTKVDVYEDVIREVRRRFPAGVIRTIDAVEAAVERWLEPYILFRIGLLAAWEHLDDQAAGFAQGTVAAH